MPLANVFTSLPTRRPLQDELHKYYTLYGSFLQAACGIKQKGLIRKNECY